MNDAPPRPDPVGLWFRRIFVAVIMLTLVGFVWDFVEPLLFGGAVCLVRFSRERTIDVPATAMFLLGSTALGVGFHFFARWVSDESQRQLNVANVAPWRLRWSATIVALVVIFFLAGICAVGIFHQSTWLMTDPEGLWQPSRSGFRSLKN